jgi:hypothetical protein
MVPFATKERLNLLGSLLAGLMLLIAGSASGTGKVATTHLPTSLDVSTQSTPVESFVTALAQGDLAKAEQVASPLYHAEWSRRGLSVRDPLLVDRRSPQLSSSPNDTLSFTYVGSVENRQGFRHLLYVARPSNATPDASPSVWRIDTDPQGMVIWAELVYLFDSGSASLTAVAPGDEIQAIDVPDEIRGLNPRVATGVRRTNGSEGYFAAYVRDPTGEKASATSADAVIFFAVDAEGIIRPGVWSYGQTDPPPMPYGEVFKAPSVSLDAATDAMRQSYLSALTGLP